MIRLFTLLSLLFILNTKVNGSTYYWMITYTKGWQNSYKSEFLGGRVDEKVLSSFDSIYSKNPNAYYFFYNGEEFQAYIGCGFDLYSINEGELKLKYNEFNRGYTCYTTPFIRDSTNYLLGGHGFWTNHFDLLRLDKTHGSWEMVNTINQPIDYYSTAVYQNSKGIYSLFGERFNPRTGLEEKVPNGYFLDWETKAWKEIEIHIDEVDNSLIEQKGNVQLIQTNDYVFLFMPADINNLGWNMIDKESGKIYFFDNLKNRDVFISPFLEIIGNKINYQSPNGTAKTLDMEDLLSKSKEVGRITIKENSLNFSKEFPSKDSIYILIIILLLLLSFNLYIRKKSEPPLSLNSNGNGEIEKMIETFSPYSSQLLTSEELDVILGIDSVDNNDSKRLKRSRWINKLNEYHTSQNGIDLIIRDKNPEDKRYIYYKVNSSDPKLNKP